MKKAKVLELVNSVETFGDAWDAADTIFKSTTASKKPNEAYTANTFEFVFKTGEATVAVVEEKRVFKNKEVDYPRKTLAKASAPTVVEAFKEAALKAFN